MVVIYINKCFWDRPQKLLTLYWSPVSFTFLGSNHELPLVSEFYQNLSISCGDRKLGTQIYHIKYKSQDQHWGGGNKIEEKEDRTVKSIALHYWKWEWIDKVKISEKTSLSLQVCKKWLSGNKDSLFPWSLLFWFFVSAECYPTHLRGTAFPIWFCIIFFVQATLASDTCTESSAFLIMRLTIDFDTLFSDDGRSCQREAVEKMWYFC